MQACPDEAAIGKRIRERRAAKMKKRKSHNYGGILRLCLGSLLALAVLTAQHGFNSRSSYSDTAQLLLWSAAPENRAHQQNTPLNLEPTQWRVEIWLPAEFVVDDDLFESAQSDTSAGRLSAPLSLTLPAYVIGLDVPGPEPLPAGFYGLFMLGFGLVGFFVVAPGRAGLLPEHRPADRRQDHYSERVAYPYATKTD